LLDLQQRYKIASQQDNNSELRDIIAQYARHINSESNPYRRSRMKKSLESVVRSAKTIQEAKKYLARKSPFSASPTLRDQIDLIRRKSGSRLPNDRNELAALDAYYKRLKREGK